MKRKKASAAPAVGKEVHYAGKVWTIAAAEKDPNTLGWFVDLVRTDEEGKYEARVHTAQLVPDTTGGYTFEEDDRKHRWERTTPPEAPHEGDPNFPLTPEFTDRHVRHNKAVEARAMARFKKSPLAKDKSWTTITESERERFRKRVRQSVRESGRVPKQ